MKAFINNTAYDFIQGETMLDFVRRIENSVNGVAISQERARGVSGAPLV